MKKEFSLLVNDPVYGFNYYFQSDDKEDLPLVLSAESSLRLERVESTSGSTVAEIAAQEMQVQNGIVSVAVRYVATKIMRESILRRQGVYIDMSPLKVEHRGGSMAICYQMAQPIWSIEFTNETFFNKFRHGLASDTRNNLMTNGNSPQVVHLIWRE